MFQVRAVSAGDLQNVRYRDVRELLNGALHHCCLAASIAVREGNVVVFGVIIDACQRFTFLVFRNLNSQE